MESVAGYKYVSKIVDRPGDLGTFLRHVVFHTPSGFGIAPAPALLLKWGSYTDAHANRYGLLAVVIGWSRFFECAADPLLGHVVRRCKTIVSEHQSAEQPAHLEKKVQALLNAWVNPYKPTAGATEQQPDWDTYLEAYGIYQPEIRAFQCAVDEWNPFTRPDSKIPFELVARLAREPYGLRAPRE